MSVAIFDKRVEHLTCSVSGRTHLYTVKKKLRAWNGLGKPAETCTRLHVTLGLAGREFVNGIRTMKPCYSATTKRERRGSSGYYGVILNFGL